MFWDRQFMVDLCNKLLCCFKRDNYSLVHLYCEHMSKYCIYMSTHTPVVLFLVANGKIDILSWKFSLMHSTKCEIQIYSSYAQRQIIFSLASGSVSHSMKKNLIKKNLRKIFLGNNTELLRLDSTVITNSFHF